MGLHEDQKVLRRRQLWLAAAGVTALGFLLQLGGDATREALAYERTALGSGELWRLVSGHFVHLGWSHMALNLAGLALVAWLVGHVFTWRQWLYVGLVSVVAIDAAHRPEESGWEVVVQSGRKRTGLDAVQWAHRVTQLVRRISPAPSFSARLAQSTASMPVGVRPP